MKRIYAGIVLFVCLYLNIKPAEQITLTLAPVQAQAGAFICCETYAPQQRLFYCVVNNVPNFQSFDANGNPYTFAPAASGLGIFEMRVAAVQPATNSPFPYGGWTLGDVFVGDQNGNVVKITGGQTLINPWITLPQKEFAQQTVFDRTATVYNGDLIVSFSTTVYRVQSSGTYQLIAKINSLKNYEGLDIVPTDTTKYGPLSGCILIPQNTQTYVYHHTQIAAISTAGALALYDTGCYTDQVFVVHQYDNFYGLARDTGQVLTAPWSALSTAGMLGEIIMMCEFWDTPHNSNSGLRRLYYTGSAVTSEDITLTSTSASAFKWEHGCFSRGGSSNVLPGGFSFCYYSTIAPTQFVGAYVITNANVLQNYGAVSTTSAFSYTGQPAASNAAITVTIIQDDQNGFYLQVVNAATGGGSVDMGLVYTGPTDSGLLVRIQNSVSDSYLWSNNQGRFKWTWAAGYTSGLVLGPIGAIIGLQQFQFDITLYSWTGVSTVRVVPDVSHPVQTASLTAGTPFTFSLVRVSCVCGQPTQSDPYFKQCDPSAGNSPCCTFDCHYQPATKVCNTSADICVSPSYCTGASPTCPPMTTSSNCTCVAPYYGNGCKQVRCDLLLSCSACSNYSACSFCCDSSTCVTNTTACSAVMAKSCPVCTCKNGGTCNCGTCTCAPGYGGPDCSGVIDCTGAVVPVGSTPKKMDVCGVCGGNGTSCLGCDGKPYGAQYDVCGVCGGNGSSCYNPCETGQCGDCISTSGCGWCSNDGHCYKENANLTTCSLKTVCPGLSVAEIAAISAGALVGIIIAAAVVAALVGVGGKKGYDYYMANRADMTQAANNPLYNAGNLTGTNPLHA